MKFKDEEIRDLLPEKSYNYVNHNWLYGSDEGDDYTKFLRHSVHLLLESRFKLKRDTVRGKIE